MKNNTLPLLALCLIASLVACGKGKATENKNSVPLPPAASKTTENKNSVPLPPVASKTTCSFQYGASHREEMKPMFGPTVDLPPEWKKFAHDCDALTREK